MADLQRSLSQQKLICKGCPERFALICTVYTCDIYFLRPTYTTVGVFLGLHTATRQTVFYLVCSYVYSISMYTEIPCQSSASPSRFQCIHSCPGQCIHGQCIRSWSMYPFMSWSMNPWPMYPWPCNHGQCIRSWSMNPFMSWSQLVLPCSIARIYVPSPPSFLLSALLPPVYSCT